MKFLQIILVPGAAIALTVGSSVNLTDIVDVEFYSTANRIVRQRTVLPQLKSQHNILMSNSGIRAILEDFFLPWSKRYYPKIDYKYSEEANNYGATILGSLEIEGELFRLNYGNFLRFSDSSKELFTDGELDLKWRFDSFIGFSPEILDSLYTVMIIDLDRMPKPYAHLVVVNIPVDAAMVQHFSQGHFSFSLDIKRGIPLQKFTRLVPYAESNEEFLNRRAKSPQKFHRYLFVLFRQSSGTIARKTPPIIAQRDNFGTKEEDKQIASFVKWAGRHQLELLGFNFVVA